jgi:hypothetical protein
VPFCLTPLFCIPALQNADLFSPFTFHSIRFGAFVSHGRYLTSSRYGVHRAFCSHSLHSAVLTILRCAFLMHCLSATFYLLPMEFYLFLFCSFFSCSAVCTWAGMERYTWPVAVLGTFLFRCSCHSAELGVNWRVGIWRCVHLEPLIFSHYGVYPCLFFDYSGVPPAGTFCTDEFPLFVYWVRFLCLASG